MSVTLPAQDPLLRRASTWRLRRPARLYDSLLVGKLDHQAADGVVSWPLALIELGTVPLRAGSLVVADPYISEPDTPPFAERLEAGDHRLILGVVDISENHRRVACAVLVDQAAPITGWRLAVLPGQLVEELEGDDNFFGFPVDAGTACLADPAAFARTVELLAADGGMLEDRLSVAFMSSEPRAVIAAPTEGADAVALVETGWGDGSYPTWLGMNAEGAVALAIVDFLLNDDAPPVAPEPDPRASRAEPGGRRRSLSERLRRSR